MSRIKRLFAVYAVFGVAVFGLATQVSAQVRTDVRGIVRNLNSGIDDFKYSLRYGLRNNSTDTTVADDAERDVTALERAVKDFDVNLNENRENRDDVIEVLRAAKPLDEFVGANSVNRTVQTDWTKVRGLLDRLAASYGVSWNWSNGSVSNTSRPTPSRPSTSTVTSRGLVGTYQIDASKSENVDEIVSGAGVSGDNADDLESMLKSSEQLAIDMTGGDVTIASTDAAAVTLASDGRVRNESINGKTVSLRAQLRGQELTISSIGGDTDFTMVFQSVDGGRALKVTRRVTTSYLTQTIFAESYYIKTDSVARLDISPNSPVDTTSDNQDPDTSGGYSSNDPNDIPGSTDPNAPTTTPVRRRTGDFLIPDGTVVSAILENYITTKSSQNNDRFRLTVQSPAEYRGAVIEGYITGINRSGRVTGSSKVTFNFETITLRDGKKYEFAGFLSGIVDPTGKTVKIDTEGTAKGDSQTKETAKRAGIGAGAGAIIGAILGGGKGAAIGAVIGGGAGAGSVVVQGKDDLELQKGSTLSITSSNPTGR